MKSIEFSEDQMPDLQTLAAQLFSDETDPRSTTYIRVLHRPKINWWRIVLSTILPLALAVLLGFGLYAWIESLLWSIIIPISSLFLYTLIRLKALLLCLIRLYQRFAPDRVRNRCRFEPSCSEYAILAIQKYGVLRGTRKSIGRLRRCNVNGGGFDDP